MCEPYPLFPQPIPSESVPAVAVILPPEIVIFPAAPLPPPIPAPLAPPVALMMPPDMLIVGYSSQWPPPIPAASSPPTAVIFAEPLMLIIVPPSLSAFLFPLPIPAPP